MTGTKIYDEYYSDIPKKDYDKIIAADPTSIKLDQDYKPTVFVRLTGTLMTSGEKVIKNGKYCRWLLDSYRKGNLKIEDLYKAKEYLKTFHLLKTKNKIPDRYKDIGQFHSLSELFKINKEIGGTGKPQEDENCLITDRYHINNGNTEVYFEDSNWLIVIPKTLSASQFYGNESEWCTIHSDSFKEYSSYGNLYILIDKNKINRIANPKRRFQLQFETSQFMDMDDAEVGERDFDGFLKRRGLLEQFEDARVKSLANKKTWEQNEDFDYNLRSWVMRMITTDEKNCRIMFDAMIKCKYEFDNIFEGVTHKEGKQIVENLGPERFEILVKDMMNGYASLDMLPDAILLHDHPFISNLSITDKVEGLDTVGLNDFTQKQLKIILDDTMWFISLCKKHGCDLSPEMVEKLLKSTK